VLSILVTFLVMRLLFRGQLHKRIECEVEDTKLSANGKLVLAGLALMIAVLLTASAMKKELVRATNVPRRNRNNSRRLHQGKKQSDQPRPRGCWTIGGIHRNRRTHHVARH
jgi:hypothetical protein